MNKGSSVFDALNTTFSVKYGDFQKLGKFITSIDEVNQTSDRYWMYFVNGNFALVSVDNYFLNDNSNIEFVFVDSKTAMSYFR